ncbi:MAG: UPF0280 family protein [Burkholderiaceae bacterium]
MAVTADKFPLVMPPLGQLLPDGKRLHLQHGPIDLVIEASGSADQVQIGYECASRAFDGLLQALVDELAVLRVGVSPDLDPGLSVTGPVARRMMQAVQPFGKAGFVTPMAAVAGAVADHVLGQLCASAKLDRAYVNNGGDIAIMLTPATRYRAAICSDPSLAGDGGRIDIEFGDGVGGIATSGWRGRSHSLGIADAVTVLARDAAAADVAATLIANAVNLPVSDSRVRRAPALVLAPDSDLGERLVTTGVEPLDADSIQTALQHGQQFAQRCCDENQIVGALLNLQGRIVVCGQKLQRVFEQEWVTVD